MTSKVLLATLAFVTAAAVVAPFGSAAPGFADIQTGAGSAAGLGEGTIDTASCWIYPIQGTQTEAGFNHQAWFLWFTVYEVIIPGVAIDLGWEIQPLCTAAGACAQANASASRADAACDAFETMATVS